MKRGEDRGWFFGTKQGVFWLLPHSEGAWRLFHDQALLGYYADPKDACADLNEGRCFQDDERLETEALDIPENIERWNFRMPDSAVIFWPP